MKSILAGVMISLGGMVFLSVDNTAIGAFAFSIGLLIICIYGLHLFTGKAPYMRFKDIPVICLVLVGNMIGAGCMGLFTRFARPQIIDRANQICQNKLSEGFWVIFLGMVCNVFIFYAVNTYKTYKDAVGVFATVLCVMGFILCGSEHCIANIFYFAVSDIDILTWMPYIGLNALGNALGGIIIYRALKKEESK